MLIVKISGKGTCFFYFLSMIPFYTPRYSGFQISSYAALQSCEIIIDNLGFDLPVLFIIVEYLFFNSLSSNSLSNVKNPFLIATSAEVLREVDSPPVTKHGLCQPAIVTLQVVS